MDKAAVANPMSPRLRAAADKLPLNASRAVYASDVPMVSLVGGMKSLRLDRKTSPPSAQPRPAFPIHGGRGFALTRLGPPAVL
jgi:hypothetical protein